MKTLLLFFFILANAEAKSLNILITGFGPFSKSTENMSRLLVDELVYDFQMNSKLTLSKCLLPVSFERSLSAFEKCLEGKSFDLIISLGEGLVPKVSYDLMAIPLLTTTHLKDVDGKKLGDVQFGDKRLYYKSSLPEYACSRLGKNQETLTFALNNHSGGWVCNYVAYKMQQKLQKISPQTAFTFIHVPAYSRYHEANKKNLLLAKAELIRFIKFSIKKPALSTHRDLQFDFTGAEWIVLEGLALREHLETHCPAGK